MNLCDKHGSLMKDLALGRLTEEESARARQARQSCEACSGWWQREIQTHIASIDSAVADGFADFRPPTRRRLAAWQPIAAAAVLALAVGMVLEIGGPATEESDRSSVDTALTQESFEIETLEDIDLSGLSLTVVDTDAQSDSDEIFDATQESGDLAGWSSHS